MKKLLFLGVLAFAVPVGAAPGKGPVSRFGPIHWGTVRSYHSSHPAEFDESVAALQYLLRARGFYQGKADGIYGAKTTAAVKAFQKSKGLRADGIAGPKTLPLLVVTVKRGSQGDAVRAAQIVARGAENHVGGFPNLGIQVNGIFDKATEVAVKTYQGCWNQVEDLTEENGVFGPRLWSLALQTSPDQAVPPDNSPRPNRLNAPLKWPTIKLGDDWGEGTDTRVMALQFLLRGQGFYHGQIDDVFGQQTEAAVKAFQRARKFNVDGIAGPQTLQALTGTLRRGAHGDAVRAAQILVRDASRSTGGWPNLGLETDGVFGAETEHAIRVAQQCQNEDALNLKVDGVMGPRTWCLLMGDGAG